MTSIKQAVSSPARQGLLLVAVLMVACATETVSEPEPSASKLQTLVPGFTVTRYGNETRFRHSKYIELLMDGLRKAGLPE